jgi:hypothetical protein
MLLLLLLLLLLLFLLLLQELQSQLSCAPSISASQAGDKQLSGGSSYVQQPRSHEQLPAAAEAAAAGGLQQDAVVTTTPAEHGPGGIACRASRDSPAAVRGSAVWRRVQQEPLAPSHPATTIEGRLAAAAAASQGSPHAVLSRQLQLPRAAVVEKHDSSALAAPAAEAAIAETLNDCGRLSSSRSSRPASASAQLLRQSLGAFESTAGSAAAVKALAAQAEGLATALAAAARDAADAK